ncbi:MAG: sarcosine oxidase subunit delta [Acidihalobacter sp.]|jgi:sarcosine oxidase, subunit delta|uniref:sarcosine oxidase subunit delta n=1 Tax=Acidihalobacter sp. TaxID=1872108 RepID=UPI00307CD713
MKLIDCPSIGPRPAAEFVYGGAWRPMPDPDACSDADWAHYVFHRDGAPGVRRELWYHGPSGTWLVAERDTLSDRFLRTTSLADAVAEEGDYA